MKLPIKLTKHKKYENMYYVVWEDGVISRDFYNISWAKNHLCLEPVILSKYTPKFPISKKRPVHAF